jgi:hypothetical protein
MYRHLFLEVLGLMSEQDRLLRSLHAMRGEAGLRPLTMEESALVFGEEFVLALGEGYTVGDGGRAALHDIRVRRYLAAR